MNKLEKLHLDAIENGIEGNDYWHQEIAAFKSTKITKDIAIKFALWIDSSSFVYDDEVGTWYNIDNEKKTNEELFDIFINKFYE